MDVKQQELLNRITIKPGLMGGCPTVRGLRFPVSDILELMASGLTEAEILEQHPILEQLDIQAALLYASMKVKNTAVIYAALSADCREKLQKAEGIITQQLGFHYH